MKIASRWQPLVFAALAGLALAAFAAYDLYRERNSSVIDVEGNTRNLARLLEAHTQQILRRVEAQLALGAASIHKLPEAPELAAASVRENLQAMLPTDRLVSALVWLAADGHIVASTLTAADEAWAKDHLQDWHARHLAQTQASGQARVTVGSLQTLREGVWRVPVGLALPAGAASRHDAAAVVALVDPEALQTVFDSVDTGTNGFVSLFLSDGWMLATAPRNESLFGRNWFDAPMFKLHLPKARVGTVQQVVVRDGTERIYSYRALEDYPLVVSVGISMTDTLADWRNRIFWDTLLLAGVCGALGLAATGMARSSGRREASERSAAEQARQAQAEITAARDEAQRSERFLRAITDKLPLRIAYLDRSLRYRFVNRAQSERLGLPREAIIGKTRQEILQHDAPAGLALAVPKVLMGQEQRVEFEDHFQDQRQVLEAYLVPDIDPSGAVQGLYVAATDMTERQAQQARLERALAERETLLREVYHRVKNNLQVIQSLLSLQRRSLPEGLARAALNDSIQRVQAMALVHEKLYQAGNLEAIALPDYTADLLRHLGEAADAGRRRITLSARIDPIEVPLQEAVPFGLLVTELVMNSLKHAFPDGRSGSIVVQLRCTPQGAQLRVQDDGCGLPAGFALDALDALDALGASMGLQLAISLAQQLGGELQADRQADPQADPQAGACFSATLGRLDGR